MSVSFRFQRRHGLTLPLIHLNKLKGLFGGCSSMDVTNLRFTPFQPPQSMFSYTQRTNNHLTDYDHPFANLGRSRVFHATGNESGARELPRHHAQCRSWIAGIHSLQTTVPLGGPPHRREKANSFSCFPTQ